MRLYDIGSLAALAAKLMGNNVPISTGQVANLPPKMQESEPAYFKDFGAKRVKVRYGPYNIGSANQMTFNSLLTGEGGMMDSIHPNDQKPCTNCMVTRIQAGLEFPNGTEANTDHGLWLHHVILSLDAPDRHDRVCGWMPKERIFSSGNERMPADLTGQGTVKAGMPFYDKDHLRITLELMNQNPTPQQAYLTVTWDYVPFVKQHDFQEVGAMWFDVSNCGFSFMFPPAGKNVFEFIQKPWVSTVNGKLLFVGGHLHDGGADVLVNQNNKQVCDSKADYGSNKFYVTDHGKDDGMKHISNMTACHDFGRISLNDTWTINAQYDFARYPAMVNDKGKRDSLMGIAIMYATLEPGSYVRTK